MAPEHVVKLIKSVLSVLRLCTQSRFDLLLKTGYVESRYQYIYELSGGPGRGFWQVNPETAYDNYIHYLNYPKNHSLRSAITKICKIDDMAVQSIESIDQLLQYNIAFCLCMAVVKYKRDPMALPQPQDIVAQGKYWDRVYNHPMYGLTASDFTHVVSSEPFLQQYGNWICL